MKMKNFLAIAALTSTLPAWAQGPVMRQVDTDAVLHSAMNAVVLMVAEDALNEQGVKASPKTDITWNGSNYLVRAASPTKRCFLEVEPWKDVPKGMPPFRVTSTACLPINGN